MRRPAGVILAVLAAVAAGFRGLATACDVCAVYTATELRERRTGVRLGVAEQFTRFTTLSQGGDEVDNPDGEELNSSITQLFLGYNVTPRVGVQVNIPIIARTFERLEDGRLVSGSESGIGDVSLVGNVLAFSTVTERSVLRVSLLGGLKFPTGDPDRLGEETEEDADETGPAARRAGLGLPLGRHAIGPRHTTGGPEPPGGGGSGAGTHHESGIHGHDLALGSGSWDGLIGGQLFWSRDRLFATAGAQYSLRTEGDFDYEYANDLLWSTGPGFFALLEHGYALGIQAMFTGETKGNDRQQGVKLDDTALTALYVGPAISFTWGPSLELDVTADLPVVQHNTGLQILADFRLRGGLSWRF